MPYDESLAGRIRQVLAGQSGLTEKEMFGGIGFMLNDNMACGVVGEELCVRVGPEGNDDALAQPGARPFDFSGRPMKGWVYVSPKGFSPEGALEDWVKRGADFASSLAPK